MERIRASSSARDDRKLNRHTHPSLRLRNAISKTDPVSDCVSGAVVVELRYGVLVSYVGRSSNETDFEHVIGACVFFVVVWSEFRLQ